MAVGVRGSLQDFKSFLKRWSKRSLLLLSARNRGYGFVSFVPSREKGDDFDVMSATQQVLLIDSRDWGALLCVQNRVAAFGLYTEFDSQTIYSTLT